MSSKTPVIRRIPRAEVNRTIDQTAPVQQPKNLFESVENWVRESQLNIALEKQKEEESFFRSGN